MKVVGFLFHKRFSSYILNKRYDGFINQGLYLVSPYLVIYTAKYTANVGSFKLRRMEINVGGFVVDLLYRADTSEERFFSAEIKVGTFFFQTAKSANIKRAPTFPSVQYTYFRKGNIALFDNSLNKAFHHQR